MVGQLFGLMGKTQPGGGLYVDHRQIRWIMDAVVPISLLDLRFQGLNLRTGGLHDGLSTSAMAFIHG